MRFRQKARFGQLICLILSILVLVSGVRYTAVITDSFFYDAGFSADAANVLRNTAYDSGEIIFAKDTLGNSLPFLCRSDRKSPLKAVSQKYCLLVPALLSFCFLLFLHSERQLSSYSFCHFISCYIHKKDGKK